MSPLAFIVFFSFLWAWSREERAVSFSPGNVFFRNTLIQAAEILGGACSLLAVYELLVRPHAAAGYHPVYPLLFFAGAYALRLARRRDDVHMILVYALSVYYLPEAGESGLRAALIRLTAMTGFLAFCMLLLAGLRRRLAFSFVPASMQGLPVYFLSAAILSLALWGLQGFLIHF